MNTIAAPASSQAAITSESRTDPPGWTSAVAPASIASWGPSGKGKNASEATTDPASSSSASSPRARRAFSIAILTESTRLICPAPIPSVAPSFAITIAFERTWRHTFQANHRSSHWLPSGFAWVTTCIASRSSSIRSGSCTRSPPRTRFTSRSRGS